MASPDNFLLNSDYPVDKIVYKISGSFSATGGGGLGTLSQFNHNLGFRPLIIGTWSTDSNFSTSREGGFFSFEGTDPDTIYTQFYSNDTQISISTFNPTVPTVTIYYRIYGFMPSNINADAAFTASLADKFQLNTDYNYTKLYLSGITTAAATTTITHNLGYRPQVMAWLKDASIYGTEMIVDMGYIKVTTTTIVITAPSNDVHYMIYADGQL